jgi:hypothetical protein
MKLRLHALADASSDALDRLGELLAATDVEDTGPARNRCKDLSAAGGDEVFDLKVDDRALVVGGEAEIAAIAEDRPAPGARIADLRRGALSTSVPSSTASTMSAASIIAAFLAPIRGFRACHAARLSGASPILAIAAAICTISFARRGSMPGGGVLLQGSSGT